MAEKLVLKFDSKMLIRPIELKKLLAQKGMTAQTWGERDTSLFSRSNGVLRHGLVFVAGGADHQFLDCDRYGLLMSQKRQDIGMMMP